MTESESLEVFTRSMERCIATPSFFDRFYARFLLSNEEIAAKFAKVDLKRQAGVLRASLYHVIRAAQGAIEGVQHLDEIARSHDRKGHDIQPRHYAHWLDCLVAVAREVDPAFDAPTELVWRRHLGRAIDVMIARHASTV